jgi:hypothetical protein
MEQEMSERRHPVSATEKGDQPTLATGRRFALRVERLDEQAVPAIYVVTAALDAVNPTDGKLSLVTDQRGLARSNDGDGSKVVDIGAFEK